MTELQPFKEEKTGFLVLKIKLGKRPLDTYIGTNLVPILIRTYASYGLNVTYIAQKMQKIKIQKLHNQSQ